MDDDENDKKRGPPPIIVRAIVPAGGVYGYGLRAKL
jgi:hypothetical protein